MNQLPEILREKIILDAILLQRTNKGWNKVHYNILYSPLYLKRTHNIYSHDFQYNIIMRISKSVYFSGMIYTWLKRMEHNPLLFYYTPKDVNYNDIFSTNSNGEFLDDIAEYGSFGYEDEICYCN